MYAVMVIPQFPANLINFCVLGVKVSVVLTMQATIYGGLKQVVVLPWRSRKAKKDGLLS